MEVFVDNVSPKSILEKNLKAISREIIEKERDELLLDVQNITKACKSLIVGAELMEEIIAQERR